MPVVLKFVVSEALVASKGLLMGQLQVSVKSNINIQKDRHSKLNTNDILKLHQ